MDVGTGLTVMSVCGVVIAAVLKMAPSRKTTNGGTHFNGLERRAGHEARLHAVEDTLSRVGKKLDEISEMVQFMRGAYLSCKDKTKD